MRPHHSPPILIQLDVLLASLYLTLSSTHNGLSVGRLILCLILREDRKATLPTDQNVLIDSKCGPSMTPARHSPYVPIVEYGIGTPPHIPLLALI